MPELASIECALSGPRRRRTFNSQPAMVVLGLLLTSLAMPACGRSRDPRRMPKGVLPYQPDQHAHAGVSYRQTAGTPIAPVVIADEPSAPVAQASAGEPQAASRPSTLNGDPNGLTREALSRSLQGAMGSLATCFSSSDQDPMVAVSFEAEPSGRPSMLRIGGAPPQAEQCIRNIVQNIRFPSFEGKAVPVDLPLSFHRVAQPTEVSQPTV